MEFSAAVKRILGISEQNATPLFPSNDESNAVFNSKTTNNRRSGQQQRSGREQASFVDEKALERREKQLQKAKEHAVYNRYAAAVPRLERMPGDPQTPNKSRNYSRRDFDNRVKNWKKSLHRWEERFEEENALAEGVSATAFAPVFEDIQLVPY